MWWLILEAAGAFFIFVFIVWWTMFSGRKPDRPATQKKAPPTSRDKETNS
jgi:hypothetical protein